MKNTITNSFKAALWSIALVFGMMACTQMEDLDSNLESELMRKSSPINTGNFLNARVGNYTNTDCEGPYEISLNVGDNNDGTYSWIWTVTSRGDAKDISHWNIFQAECLELENIVSAAYKTGDEWVTFFQLTIFGF